MENGLYCTAVYRCVCLCGFVDLADVLQNPPHLDSHSVLAPRCGCFFTGAGGVSCRDTFSTSRTVIGWWTREAGNVRTTAPQERWPEYSRLASRWTRPQSIRHGISLSLMTLGRRFSKRRFIPNPPDHATHGPMRQRAVCVSQLKRQLLHQRHLSGALPHCWARFLGLGRQHNSHRRLTWR
jgi:hypothetical protein